MANYIKTVADDDQLFASFFWWRKFYEIQSAAQVLGEVR